MNVRDNPVKATLPLTVAAAWFFQDLTDFGVDVLLAAIGPEAADAIGASLRTLALALAAGGAYLIGKWVQRNFTEPKGVIDEIVAAMANDPTVASSQYARGRVLEGVGIDPFAVDVAVRDEAH